MDPNASVAWVLDYIADWLFSTPLILALGSLIGFTVVYLGLYLLYEENVRYKTFLFEREMPQEVKEEHKVSPILVTREGFFYESDGFPVDEVYKFF